MMLQAQFSMDDGVRNVMGQEMKANPKPEKLREKCSHPCCNSFMVFAFPYFKMSQNKVQELVSLQYPKILWIYGKGRFEILFLIIPKYTVTQESA
ncbi:hypothetical protein J6590_003703 [Homalodisca vitripennis]|nr:hypothetical protein J6590_003703 [Homalodisca vitripennis]